MSDYLSNILLIDIASYIFVFGVLFLAVNVSRRTGKPFFRILFGLERKALRGLVTQKEKIAVIFLFIIFFVFAYLDSHNFRTLGDAVSSLLLR